MGGDPLKVIFRKNSTAEKQRKSKKTPDSTIGFFEYGTRKTIVLGQNTSKNMNSVKLLIHGRRAIKSHFFAKNRLLKNIENQRKHLTLP